MPATDFQSLLSDANVACYQNASDDDFLLLELALLEQIVLTLNPSATTDPQSLLNIAQNLVPPGSPNPASYLNLPPGFFNTIQLALLQDIVLQLGTGGGSTWTPSTPIAGATLIEWLKGDTLTGASGSEIDDWPASAGSDATQTPSSGANPTVLTGTYFHPVARFNGTSDLLSLALGSSTAQPVTLAIFLSYKGGAVTSTFLGMGTAGGPPTIGTAGGQFTASAGSSVNLQATDSAPHILFLVFNGASSKYAFDGGALVTANLGTDNVSPASIGAANNLTNYAQIDVGEILIWAGDTSASYTNIFNYLYNRWFFQP